MTINKVTVLGAGTMGAQLAALFVNAGLKYCSGQKRSKSHCEKILR